VTNDDASVLISPSDLPSPDPIPPAKTQPEWHKFWAGRRGCGGEGGSGGAVAAARWLSFLIFAFGPWLPIGLELRSQAGDVLAHFIALFESLALQRLSILQLYRGELLSFAYLCMIPVR